MVKNFGYWQARKRLLSQEDRRMIAQDCGLTLVEIADATGDGLTKHTTIRTGEFKGGISGHSVLEASALPSAYEYVLPNQLARRIEQAEQAA